MTGLFLKYNDHRFYVTVVLVHMHFERACYTEAPNHRVNLPVTISHQSNDPVPKQSYPFELLSSTLSQVFIFSLITLKHTLSK